MKRLSIYTYILISGLLFNNPVFSEENINQPESSSVDIQAVNILEDTISEATSENSTTIQESDNQSEKNIDDSEENEDSSSENNKKQEPVEAQQNIWVDNVNGKLLNNLKSNLEDLQKIYNLNYKNNSILKEKLYSVTTDKQKLRNNLYLLNLAEANVFTIYASTYIFPELLKIKIQSTSKELLSIEKELTDEIEESGEVVHNILDDIHIKLCNLDELINAYNMYVMKAENFLDKILINTNNNINNLEKFGYNTKRTNNTVFNYLKNRLDNLKDNAEEIKDLIIQSQNEIKVVNTTDTTLAIKGKHIAHARAKLTSIEKIIDSYENRLRFNHYKFSTIINDLYKQSSNFSEQLATKKNSYKIELPSKNIEEINFHNELDNIFSIISAKESNIQLFENLLSYLENNSWNKRYIEPNDEKMN